MSHVLSKNKCGLSKNKCSLRGHAGQSPKCMFKQQKFSAEGVYPNVCLNSKRLPAEGVHPPVESDAKVYWLRRFSLLPALRRCLSLFAPPSAGLFFRSNGVYGFDQYFCSGSLRVQPPENMLFLDLPIILVDQSLHKIKDQ